MLACKREKIRIKLGLILLNALKDVPNLIQIGGIYFLCGYIPSVREALLSRNVHCIYCV